MPDCRAVQLVDFAGGLGDQLCRFQFRIGGAVAMPSQSDDQALLGARAQHVLDVFVLGLLMLLQRRAQSGVLRPEILIRFRLASGHQIAPEQLATILLANFAEFGDVLHAVRRVQSIAD